MTKMINKVIVLTLACCVFKVLCKENKEETKVGVEYMHVIIRNIPRLFGYCLDMLEQNVEILERDDITAFQEKSDACSDDECKDDKVKREIDKSLANDNHPLNYGKKIDDTAKKSADGGNNHKRQDSHYAYDGVYTTEIHEYGQASGPNVRNANTKSLDEIEESLHKLNEIIETKSIDKPFTKRFAEINNNKAQSYKKERRNKNANARNKNVAHFDEDFAGIDSSHFYLSAEEVEEKAIRIEQMIEDHNKRNR